MKKTILALCLTMALLIPFCMGAQTASQSGQTLELTLEDCLRIALSDNPTVKVADMEVQRMDYSKLETLSSLLPQANFIGSYSRTLAKQVMYMSMSGFGGSSSSQGGSADSDSESESSSSSSQSNSGIKVGLDNSYQVGFSASVPLIAPQLWASLKLSDNQILQAVEQARSSRLNLVNQVKNAYYTLLLAEDSRKVIQESYNMAALTHEIYTKKFAAGAASEYDVLRTSVAMKNVEPELTQADIAIKQARLQLLILMGLDGATPFSIQGTLKNYEKVRENTIINPNPDYSLNSQLVLNELQTKQLAQALNVQKASLFPTLSASANYMWNSMSNGSPLKNFRWTPYSTVGLSLNLPLLTSGGRYSRIKQAKVQLMEMQWQRENLQRTVSNQVNLAIDNIKLNAEQITSCTESVGQAAKAHDIMTASFDIGAASYLELRDSELALTQSRLAYYQSIYNYLVAESQLEYLLGNARTDY